MTENLPFQYEQKLLGLVLAYSDAAKLIVPTLTHDRFVFSREGGFGTEHMRIWQVMTILDRAGMSIDPSNVAAQLGTDKEWLSYLGMLQTILRGFYRVAEYRPEDAIWLRDEVDKDGVLYRNASASRKFGDTILSVGDFAKFCEGVEDVDIYMNGYIGELYRTLQSEEKGYRHVSSGSQYLRDRLTRAMNGEQNFILPTGMPSLDNRGFNRLGRHCVVHGYSGSGKSTIVHQAQLGAAIGLYLNGIKGCVAVNSMEERFDDLQLKWAGILAGVDISKVGLGGRWTNEEYQRILIAMDFVDRLPIYVDPTNFIKLSAREYAATSLHASEYGPVWMFSLDFLELMRNDDPDGSRERDVASLVTKSKDLATLTGAAVWDISQSTYKDTHDKHYIAGPSGPRYSSTIQHVCDDMLEIWNPLNFQQKNMPVIAPSGFDLERIFLIHQKRRQGQMLSPFPFIPQLNNQRVLDETLNNQASMNKGKYRVFDLDYQLDFPEESEVEQPRQRSQYSANFNMEGSMFAEAHGYDQQ